MPWWLAHHGTPRVASCTFQPCCTNIISFKLEAVSRGASLASCGAPRSVLGEGYCDHGKGRHVSLLGGSQDSHQRHPQAKDPGDVRSRSWVHPRIWHTLYVSALHFRGIKEGLLYQRRAGGCTQGDEVVEPTDRRFGLGSKWVTQCFQDPRQPHRGPYPARTHLYSCSSGREGHGRVRYAFTVVWGTPPGLGALQALPVGQFAALPAHDDWLLIGFAVLPEGHLRRRRLRATRGQPARELGPPRRPRGRAALRLPDESS